MFRRICLVAWVLFSVGVCQADPQPIGAFIGTTELLEVNIQRSAKIDNNALVYDAATGKLILEAQTATADAHAPTHQPNGSDTLSDTYTVTNRQVIAGTGMTGGGDLSADRTLTLADTAVTPGTYGGATVSAQIVIDQQGRATSASDVTITGVTPAAHQASHQSTGSDPLNATYTVTTRQVIAGTGMTGGGDLSADRTLTLADTAVTPGTYGGATVSAQIVIDQQGRVTSATDVAIPAFSGDVGDTTQGELDNDTDGYVHINDPLAVTGNVSTTGTLDVAANYALGGTGMTTKGEIRTLNASTGINFEIEREDSGEFYCQLNNDGGANVKTWRWNAYYHRFGRIGANPTLSINVASGFGAPANDDIVFDGLIANTDMYLQPTDDLYLNPDGQDVFIDGDLTCENDVDTAIWIGSDSSAGADTIVLRAGGANQFVADTSNVTLTQPIEYGGSETAGSVVLVAGTATVTHNLGMDSPTTSYLVYATPQADPGAVFNVVQRYNDFDIVATNDVRVNWMIIIN